MKIRTKGKINRKDLDSAFRLISLGIYKDVIIGTPVDTGRARGNWQLALSRVPSGTSNKKDKAVQGSMSGPASSTVREGEMKMKAHKIGSSVFIANNLAYIGELEEGQSKQNAGFVQNALNRAEKRLLVMD